MGMLLQNFNLKLDDPTYDLRVKSNLTIKPEGLFMRASLRGSGGISDLQERVSGASSRCPGNSDVPPPLTDTKLNQVSSLLHLLKESHKIFKVCG